MIFHSGSGWLGKWKNYVIFIRVIDYLCSKNIWYFDRLGIHFCAYLDWDHNYWRESQVLKYSFENIPVMHKVNKPIHIIYTVPLYLLISRGVTRGGWRGPWGQSPSKFGRSVNPIQTRGADYAPHTTASPPPRIQKAIYTSDTSSNSKLPYPGTLTKLAIAKVQKFE